MNMGYLLSACWLGLVAMDIEAQPNLELELFLAEQQEMIETELSEDLSEARQEAREARREAERDAKEQERERAAQERESRRESGKK